MSQLGLLISNFEKPKFSKYKACNSEDCVGYIVEAESYEVSDPYYTLIRIREKSKHLVQHLGPTTKIKMRHNSINHPL